MSSTAFIEPLPFINFVTQLLNRDALARPLSDADRVKIKKALRGVKVEVTRRGTMRRKYRIFALKNCPAAYDKFVDAYGLDIAFPASMDTVALPTRRIKMHC